MKDNTVIKTAIAIFFVFLLFSCSKDFLNKYPLDQISSESFWKSKTDLDMALAGCYDRLRDGGWGGSPLNYQRGYFDGLSDGGFVYWSLFGIQSMSRGNISPQTEWVVDQYQNCYKGIATCNFFLDNVDKATSVDQATRTEYKGEVQFLRSIWYFELANTFGGVPIITTTPATPAAAEIAKSTIDQVYTLILSDLDFAISNLPDTPYLNLGHATKSTAMGYKTRVLLYQGKWAEAAALAQQIIGSNMYQIQANYAGMFNNSAQTNSSEIMFSCKYFINDAPGPYGYNIEYAAHLFLRKNLIDAYECIDGLPISESPLYDPTNVFLNRDPRFNATVRFPTGEDWPGFYTYATFNPTGYENKKYLDPTIPGDYADAYREDWSTVLLRYADILLMYAEAQNELSGPDASVYNAMNQVRERPGINMPPVDQTKYNSQSSLRDYIRHERFVEFPQEGIRYFDLKRWKIAHILLPTVQDIDGTNLVFTQTNYLWPFPQSEMDINKNLVQNPGY